VPSSPLACRQLIFEKLPIVRTPRSQWPQALAIGLSSQLTLGENSLILKSLRSSVFVRLWVQDKAVKEIRKCPDSLRLRQPSREQRLSGRGNL